MAIDLRLTESTGHSNDISVMCSTDPEVTADLEGVNGTVNQDMWQGALAVKGIASRRFSIDHSGWSAMPIGSLKTLIGYCRDKSD